MGRKKVVILGGGVAGMSAAMELIERGFDVEVCERKSIPGGKARSIPALGPSLGSSPFQRADAVRGAPRHVGPPLPGEHGFRFFPGFYKHVIDTMARIPYRGGSVAENLVGTREVKLASFDRPPFVLPAQFPRSTGDLKVDVFAIIAVLSGQTGVGLDDGVFFATKLWQFLTSCPERRLAEYEKVNWWDFIEADSRSPNYQKYFGNGITRSLVAAKARRASTKTIGDIFAQFVFGILSPGVSTDRVLNGPTSDVWINPWLAHLRKRGVVYHTDAEVRAIRCERGRVKSALVGSGANVREVSGDYFIGAVPVERMSELVTPDLLKGDPSLANLDELNDYVEWMNGIQYYLTEDVPMAHGHAIFVDSPWALTSVSQAQFWNDFPPTGYGDGTVRGILSVDISDWDVTGLNGKKAQNCSRQEIALETWEEMKKSLNAHGKVLTDEKLHSWFLDPDIDDLQIDAGTSKLRVNTNAEPLLVNYVDTWRIRPEAVTRIPNFFLASDYVRTFTDLATMEAANEAARRAVNGVLRAAHSEAEPCAVWNLHEPELFLPLRAHDRTRFRKGLTWDSQAISLVHSALSLATHAPEGADPAAGDDAMQGLVAHARRVVGLAPEPAASFVPRDATAPPSDAPDGAGQVAAEARTSSDRGLRRMRIVPTP